MNRNVEIKARDVCPDHTSILAAKICTRAEYPIMLLQTDTFYRSNQGRLKLREFGKEKAELIWYEREDKNHPKTSSYSIAQVTDIEATKDVLSRSNTVLGKVVKKRLLYMVGNTRVHLDRVKGLGDFVELEVVLEENQSYEYGERIAKAIMRQLEISEENLLKGSYMDMIHYHQ